jgi:hypothetical protein
MALEGLSVYSDGLFILINKKLIKLCAPSVDLNLFLIQFILLNLTLEKLQK